jgi:hypothetical protein
MRSVRSVFIEGWVSHSHVEPFRVGESVTWKLAHSWVDPRYLRSVLDSDVATSITDGLVDHKDALSMPDDAETATGIVRSIRAGFCEFTLQAGAGPGGRDALMPVPGSNILEEREFGDGQDPGWDYRRQDERDDGRNFVGYVVALDVVHVDRIDREAMAVEWALEAVEEPPPPAGST